MKNLFTFYVLIIVPFGILIWLNNSGLISGFTSFGLIIFYSLIYRTYTDGKRLADKNIIQKHEIWKMIIPGKRMHYFRELYLK